MPRKKSEYTIVPEVIQDVNSEEIPAAPALPGDDAPSAAAILENPGGGDISGTPGNGSSGEATVSEISADTQSGETDGVTVEDREAEKKDAPEPSEHAASPPEPDSTATAPASEPELEPKPKAKPKLARARKKTIYDLDINGLDRNLSPEEQREWSAIYASFRSKSVLTGTVIGSEQTSFDIENRETGEVEKKTLSSLIIIDYRVKVLIPESEMWMPGEERPSYVLRNMTGSEIDYVIMDVDREGECAIGSRRVALAAKRHYFATARGGHTEGDLLKCRVIAAGPHRCSVECSGYDVELTQRDLSYTAIADLREKFHPGQELACRLKEYDRKAAKLVISVKEAKPNPFVGADKRHPVNCRRQATISGKYKGGVFCTLPDDTVCLCLYSAQHSDMDFDIGDSVIVVIRQYDYGRNLIFGRILAKW